MKLLTIVQLIVAVRLVEVRRLPRELVGDVAHLQPKYNGRFLVNSQAGDNETTSPFVIGTDDSTGLLAFYAPLSTNSTRITRHVPPEYEKRIENYSCTKRGIANNPNAEAKTQWGVCSKHWVYCAAPEARPDLLSCPADLRFDQEQELCLSEEYVFGCSGKRLNEPVTALVQLDEEGKPMESPVKPAPDGFCNEQEDGFYPLLQGQCSPEYVACVDDEGSLLECAKGQAYFVEKERCEFVENLPECGGSRPIFDESSLEKEIEKNTLPPPFICDKEGVVPDPRPEAITQWGVCSQTWFYCPAAELPPDMLSCPAELYYDTESSLCIKKKDIYSCTGKIPKSTTPTRPSPAPRSLEREFEKPSKAFEKPSKPLKDASSVNDYCSEQPDGSYEWQGRCTQNFVICKDHLGYLISCPDLTLFSSTANECVPNIECN